MNPVSGLDPEQSRCHHPDGNDDDGKQKQREDHWSSDFVLLRFVVVVMFISHAAKIQGETFSIPIQSSHFFEQPFV